MNLDNEELLVTKHKRKLISYTKQVANGKLDKNFYNAYCELYDLLCEYMNAYNRLEEELENKTYNITIPLKNSSIEDIEYYYKYNDKWYAHYKETQVDKTKVKELEEQAKSKVTEKELKDMILGMLE